MSLFLDITYLWDDWNVSGLSFYAAALVEEKE